MAIIATGLVSVHNKILYVDVDVRWHSDCELTFRLNEYSEVYDYTYEGAVLDMRDATLGELIDYVFGLDQKEVEDMVKLSSRVTAVFDIDREATLAVVDRLRRLGFDRDCPLWSIEHEVWEVFHG